MYVLENSDSLEKLDNINSARILIPLSHSLKVEQKECGLPDVIEDIEEPAGEPRLYFLITKSVH